MVAIPALTYDDLKGLIEANAVAIRGAATPLEWLAFRGLPLLPSFPRRTRIITAGVVGHGDDMTFMWPLWCIPASLVDD